MSAESAGTSWTEAASRTWRRGSAPKLKTQLCKNAKKRNPTKINSTDQINFRHTASSIGSVLTLPLSHVGPLASALYLSLITQPMNKLAHKILSQELHPGDSWSSRTHGGTSQFCFPASGRQAADPPASSSSSSRQRLMEREAACSPT